MSIVCPPSISEPQMAETSTDSPWLSLRWLSPIKEGGDTPQSETPETRSTLRGSPLVDSDVSFGLSSASKTPEPKENQAANTCIASPNIDSVVVQSSQSCEDLDTQGGHGAWNYLMAPIDMICTLFDSAVRTPESTRNQAANTSSASPDIASVVAPSSQSCDLDKQEGTIESTPPKFTRETPSTQEKDLDCSPDLGDESRTCGSSATSEQVTPPPSGRKLSWGTPSVEDRMSQLSDLKRSGGDTHLTVANMAKHRVLNCMHKIEGIARLPQAQEIEGPIKGELSTMRILLDEMQSSSSSNSSGNPDKKKVPTPRQGATTIPKLSDNTNFIDVKDITHEAALKELLRKEVNLWSAMVSGTDQDCLDIAEELLSIVFDNGATLVVHAPYYELLKLFDRSTATDDHAFLNHLVNDGADTIKKQSSERFRHWHRAFSQKWPKDKFPDDYEVESLRGKRTDGYFGISSSGKVFLAAALFAPNSRAKLAFKDMGARHKTALDIALKLKHCIVFVKSEQGIVHVLTAGGVRNKEAYCLVADAADPIVRTLEAYYPIADATDSSAGTFAQAVHRHEFAFRSLLLFRHFSCIPNCGLSGLTRRWFAGDRPS